ncbi:hypothetical protein D3C81_683750 [compost metagenome]
MVLLSCTSLVGAYNALGLKRLPIQRRILLSIEMKVFSLTKKSSATCKKSRQSCSVKGVRGSFSGPPAT